MPMLSAFHNNSFLGTCEYIKRDGFRLRIKKLCEINNWKYENVYWVHHYCNSLVGVYGHSLQVAE
jgi:hypothetical protein